MRESDVGVAGHHTGKHATKSTALGVFLAGVIQNVVVAAITALLHPQSKRSQGTSDLLSLHFGAKLYHLPQCFWAPGISAGILSKCHDEWQQALVKYGMLLGGGGKEHFPQEVGT
eukprot:CAMPEP_0171915408 /NCGR_PEP_ID=MMETSP0993-20121228/13796_1 /TAXON_ID=483369 /ORGANISM="non described non described, Strain CCMP2098" /LENGTH=114 /DNA_ID=CAMNT_0012550383 /DNA_START=366 /DNA_END=710 /DNA_ORIENTATION=+